MTPEVRFEVTGVEHASRGITPMLHFHLHIDAAPATATIHSILLQTQIQIESPRRSYNPDEQEKLVELFGTPDRWGQTLRSRLWTHANVVVPAFTGSTNVILPAQCTSDMSIAATKYFSALEEGEIPLLFLFSGTMMYSGDEKQLQMGQISWNCEASFRMPVATWQSMMDMLYPGISWLSLDHDTFQRLYAYRRRHNLATWERTIERLLDEEKVEEATS